jgi:hypothetical protein
VSENTKPLTISPDQVAQTALTKLRALCKGNGVKLQTIQLKSHDIDLHTLYAGTYLELRPVVTEREAPGKIMVGKLAQNREDAGKLVDQAMANVARDSSMKTQIVRALLSRPDKGFGVNGQPIPLDFIKYEFTWHDSCQTCRGTGQSSCPKCRGQRVEPCIKCSGRGLMFCPNCRGTGLLQGVKCQKCQAQRYVACDQCRKSGMMQCRTCSGHGTSKCSTCSGQGMRSHVIGLSASAMTYFEYDGKSIPQGAAHMIEAEGSNLVPSGKVKLEPRMADDKENAIGASYEVTFPFGEIEFSIGKKDFHAGVFGYKTDFVNLPNILDKLVQKGVEELEEAAGDVGSVSEKIRRATRYRLIAQAFLYAIKTDPDKGIPLLLKKYDAGLSHSMAEKIILLAENAIAKISRKPRIQGFIIGFGISAIFTAAYYFAPIRSSLAAFLPNQHFDAIFEIVPVVFAGIVTPIIIRIMAAGSVRNALGHLLPDTEKKTLVPKTGKAGLIGYGAGFIFMVIAVAIAGITEQDAPWWFYFLKSLFA